MATPALYTDANLYLLVICRQVNLSLEHGNCDASCFAYEWLAIVAGARFGDYAAAYSFGRLGYDLVERGLQRFQARTDLIFAASSSPGRDTSRVGAIFFGALSKPPTGPAILPQPATAAGNSTRIFL